MDEHTLKVLEFDKVRSLLSDFCLSSLGKELCHKLVPLVDKEIIQEELEMTTQLKEVLLFEERFPLGVVKDIRPCLERLEIEGTFLEPRELLDSAEVLSIAKSVLVFLEPKQKKYEDLWRIINRMKAEDSIVDAIKAAVDASGELKDSASKRLRQIRQEKISTRSRVLDKLQQILSSQHSRSPKQSEVITIRQGRYVIPMETESFTRSKGIVHDRSSSGATFFVEPFVTVELNNQLRELELEEKKEIEKILLGISDLIRQELDVIQETVRVLQLVDFIYAKARFSVEFKASPPKLNTDGFINLVKARHPLLEKNIKEKIVPLDLELGDHFNTLIITGPNTGGKTVALKVVGLLNLMAQAGMHIPAEDTSRISIFKKIYADIGDEQSIEMSISTFSSHIGRAIKAVCDCDECTLVLLDELGAGTDPKEGVALGEAILASLSEKNAKTVITTHYGMLKLLPQSFPRMRNASLEFDRETLKPTYSFRLGLPGSSYAIEVAGRLGMPKEILDRAHQLVGTQERDLSLLLESLEANLRVVSQSRKSLEEQKKISDGLLSLYQDRIRKIEIREKELENKALREAKNLVEQTKVELENLVAQIRSTQADKELVKEAHRFIDEKRKGIEEKLKGFPDQKAKEEEIGEGDVVWIEHLEVQGEVISKHGKKLKIRAKNLICEVGQDQAKKVDSPKDKMAETGEIGTSETEEAPLEVDLRGLFGDEAIEVVDKYLDRAYLSGLSEIWIIHGKGTGALRKKVSSFLSKHPRVESFRLGSWNEGGAGVTVVKLKE